MEAHTKPSKMFQNWFCTFYALTSTNKNPMAVRALSNLKTHALCAPSNLILVYTRYSTVWKIRDNIIKRKKKKMKEKKNLERTAPYAKAVCVAFAHQGRCCRYKAFVHKCSPKHFWIACSCEYILKTHLKKPLRMLLFHNKNNFTHKGKKYSWPK